MKSKTAPSFTFNPSGRDDLRRRRRLQHLLEVRDKLAVTVAAHEVHHLDDADEATQLLYAVEATMQREFPALYPRLFDTWLARDAGLAHDGTTQVLECPICQRDAAPRQGAQRNPAAA